MNQAKMKACNRIREDDLVRGRLSVTMMVLVTKDTHTSQELL